MAGLITGGVHAPNSVLATAKEFSDVARSSAEYIWNVFDNRRDKSKVATARIRFGKDADGRWYEVTDFDNGAGMDLEALQRYFTMNAPNERRMRGEVVRGRNGTGKAAAFGVGGVLEVYSVKEGVANKVILRKKALEDFAGVYPCDSLPIEHVVTNQQVAATEPQFGTRVRVSGIKQDFDDDGVIRNLTRIFQRVLDKSELLWQRTAADLRRVSKPHHASILTQDYTTRDRPALVGLIGEVTLHLAAAEVDLQRQECGVIITSQAGNVLEDNYINTGKRRSIVDKRIFGDVEAPRLDEPDEYGIYASTQARRLQMNRDSQRVKAMLFWIDECLDDFRDRVEDIIQSTMEEKDEAVLTAIASTLERVLNQQYRQFMNEYTTRMKLPKLAQAGPFPNSLQPGKGGPSPAGTGDPVYVPVDGGNVRVVKDPQGDVDIAGPGQGGDGDGGDAPGTGTTRKGRVDDAGVPAERQRRGPNKAKTGASLQVAHVGVGATSPRAYYDGEGTFTINIDHPDFEGLEKSDPEFMRRCAEGVAITYAQAVIEMRCKDGDMTVQSSTDALNAFMDEHDRVLRPLLEASAIV